MFLSVTKQYGRESLLFSRRWKYSLFLLLKKKNFLRKATCFFFAHPIKDDKSEPETGSA